MSPTTTPAAARPLNGQDYRTLGLSALGGALEFYDFIIFVFFATVIGHLFFPPEMPDWLVMIQTFGIFAAGYLVRPLGGIILAHYGDRYGRKRVFAFSILLMALSTLGMALMPTYATIGVAAPILLIILRMLQGAAIGGEVPGAWTIVAEHVPFRRVGLACGFLTSGLSFGIMLGSLIAFAINSLFSAEDVAAYAWRIPFLLGGIFGLIAVYLRRWLEETPVFTEMKKSKSLTDKLPLGLVLKHHMRGVVISALLTWVLSAAIVVTTLPAKALRLYANAGARRHQLRHAVPDLRRHHRRRIDRSCRLRHLLHGRQHLLRHRHLYLLQLCRRIARDHVRALWRHGPVRGHGGCGALCHGARLPGIGPLLGPLLRLQCLLRHLRRTDADCGDHGAHGQSDGACMVSDVHRRPRLLHRPLSLSARQRDRKSRRHRGTGGVEVVSPTTK